MEKFRLVRRFGHCVVWLVVLGLFGAAPGLAQPTPITGLGSDAVVFRDADGVPHICTGSDLDTIFMLGYVHAQDRFFQMDTLRRTFSGTLAEMVGQGALASDVQFRTFGLRRAAEESLAAYQAGLDDTLAFLEAYTRGINRYLENNPLPPEYAGLELTQAEPWTVIDTLTIGKGLGFGLSFDLLELDLTVLAGAYGAAGQAGGFDGTALLFEDTTRHAPFDPTVSIPQGGDAAVTPGEVKAAPIGTPDPRAVAMARDYLEKARQIPALEKVLDRRAADGGSNWWVVSGDNSENGYPMLASDPHLALNTPSTFYEAHLLASSQAQCGIQGSAGATSATHFSGSGGAKAAAGVSELNANGVSFPGAPGLVLGCNTDMCWGATVNVMDVTDVYQEVLVFDQTGLPTHTIFEGQPEPLVLIPQTFLFNQIGDMVPDNLADAGIGPLDGGLTLVVPRRNNGPIINIDASQQPPTALSVQYTGWRGTTEFEAFRRWLRTDDVDEFVAGLQYFDVGSQNWSYADVSGNIAYFTSAELPIREDLQTLGFPDGGIPPFLIRDGTHTLQHEWMAVQNPQPQQSLNYEILPFAEMPQVRNPAAGFIINGNNDPIGNTLDNNVLNEVRPGGGVFYLSPGYVSLRVGRIGRLMDDLLAGGGKVSLDELKAMQGNNQLLDAEIVSPYLITAFANAQAAGAPAELAALAADAGVAEAITRLMAWDFSSPTGLQAGYDPGDDPNNLPEPSADEIAHSVAATIWSAFRGQAVQNIIDGTLTAIGLGDFLPDNRAAYSALAHHLQTFDTAQGVGASGINFFGGSPGLTPAESRDLALLASLRGALDLLASDEFAPAFGNSNNQNDYRWGYLHRIEFDHILGGPFSIPSAGGFQPLSANLPGVARAGGYEAVDASRHSSRADGLNDFMFGAGPARRFVGVLDPAGIQAEQIIPGGQSGVFFDPGYASQLGRWLTNDYHPLRLSPADVGAAVISQQEFEPTCAPGPTVLCFQNNRFQATIDWTAPASVGMGRSVAFSSDASGNFYFFDPVNWEILVKVLNGCSINNHYWVFASAATDVGWTLTIEDTETGQIWSGSNPLGQRSPAITDTEAFATCP
ncbi:MAG: penicillin acylase family protein [Acidobacteriota bacterium]